MRRLSAILVLLMLGTGLPQGFTAGVLCDGNVGNCEAMATSVSSCCCGAGCACGLLEQGLPKPAQIPNGPSERVDFALSEVISVDVPAPFSRFGNSLRIADELLVAHVPPRVAVTCIRLN